jgi:prepilin-type N-terminal cleavage/methylation domain-containing protein
MTKSPSTAALVGPPACQVREGFTLLEVLVSIAILVFALAGIAALLPATGARLAEATDIDRAGTLAANAPADLLARGACRAALWPATATTRAIVFGEGLTVAGASVALASVTGTVSLANTAILGQTLNTASAFQMRDNLITSPAGIVTGFDTGLCYGCMLSSTGANPGPGTQVRMTTAVFSRPGPAVLGFVLTQTATNSPVFRITSTISGAGIVTAVTPGPPTDSLRKQYLAGCAWVVAVPTPPTIARPVWVPIASSWTSGTGVTDPSFTLSLTGTRHFVCLSGTPSSVTYGPLMSGSTLRVFGFDGLLRVDERTIRLE